MTQLGFWIVAYLFLVMSGVAAILWTKGAVDRIEQRIARLAEDLSDLRKQSTKFVDKEEFGSLKGGTHVLTSRLRAVEALHGGQGRIASRIGVAILAVVVSMAVVGCGDTYVTAPTKVEVIHAHDAHCGHQPQAVPPVTAPAPSPGKPDDGKPGGGDDQPAPPVVPPVQPVVPQVPSTPPADDGNNGHGNDPGKVDPSNPGKGHGKK